jgi:SAM-dependent methyltransferase
VSDVPRTTRTLDRCLACRSTDIVRIPLRYEFESTSFPAWRCRNCDMRFLRVQPTGEFLASLYSEQYFEADYRCGRAAGHSFDESNFRDEDRGLLDAFERLRPPGRLLEVGSAAGWLLRHATERGWTSRGVELSAAAVAQSRSLGVDVVQGDLESARFPSDAFDLVYMGDVLEHVPDCRAELVEVARVLAPGGFLYLRGPITTNSLARRAGLAAYGLAGRDIVLREPPYHLWEFTPASLRRLVAAVGLEMVSMRESKIPPGRPHGSKSEIQRTAMAALDLINEPITRGLNVWGDRVVLVSRKRIP